MRSRSMVHVTNRPDHGKRCMMVQVEHEPHVLPLNAQKHGLAAAFRTML